MYFGIPTQKEEDLWDLVKNTTDKAALLKQTAKDIYTQLENQKNKAGEEDNQIFYNRLNSFISVLDSQYFNEEDKNTVRDEILTLDRNTFITTKDSVFVNIWKNYVGQMTKDREQTMDILKRSELPEAKEIADKLEKGEL